MTNVEMVGMRILMKIASLKNVYMNYIHGTWQNLSVFMFTGNLIDSICYA